jgi:hypothetical protein
MSIRIYRQENYMCAVCGEMLRWKQRPSHKDSLMLYHGTGSGCVNSGKNFYPPRVYQVEEIPEGVL